MIKIFLAFVKKEMFHILRDTRTMIILFAMPVALVLIFGYTVSNEFKDASMAVYNQSADKLSLDLINHLTASGHFQLTALPQNIEELDASFKAGKAKLGLVIPANFEADFFKEKKTSIQLITDASEPNYATALTNYATRMINTFQKDQNQLNSIPYQVSVETSMFYNPNLVGAYTFVPGVVALILMLICAMMTSLTIAKEKETGTMDLLLVSPLSPLLIIFGKVTPYSILSFISALLVFAIGYFVFKVPIIGSLFLLLSLCLLYLLVALALGVVISTVANSQQVAMMVSLVALLLPTMLFSGFIFPIDSMPTILQYVCRLFPATYFIIIEKAIMLKGAGWESIMYPAGILVLMFVVLTLVAWRKFKVIYN